MKNIPKVNVKNGFALVATISILSLVTLLALAMASLATSSVKSSSSSLHMEVARANARLALAEAFYQLQNRAGRDRRVTATSNLNEECYYQKAYWTGFWSTESWDPFDPDNKEFLGWGVSGARGASFESVADQPVGTDDYQLMVGNGTVTQQSQHVYAPLVNIEEFTETRGSYAWWIGDEGVKASVKAYESGEHAWNQAANLATPSNNGVRHIGFDSYIDAGSDSLKRTALTRKSLELLEEKLRNGEAEDVFRGRLKDHFHDITHETVFLLTNSRRGGFRKDLSTAFELDLPSFNKIEEFHAGGENNQTKFYDELSASYKKPEFYHFDESPNCGYVAEYGTSSSLMSEDDSVPDKFFRSLTWDYLRNYYRLYKNEWDDFEWNRSYNVPKGAYSARGSLPLSYSAAIRGAQGDRGGDKFMMHANPSKRYHRGLIGRYAYIQTRDQVRKSIELNNWQNTHSERSPQLTPTILRQSFVFGVVRHKATPSSTPSLALSVDPYMVIANPYSVPISYESIGMFTSKFRPLDYYITWINSNDEEIRTRLQSDYFTQHTYSRGAYAHRLEPSIYVLQPGEIKVISPNNDNPVKGNRTRINVIKGTHSYSEDSGLYVTNTQGITPKEGSDVKIRLTGYRRTGVDVTAEHFNYSVHSTKDHNGVDQDIFRHTPYTYMLSDWDIFDDVLISNLSIATRNLNIIEKDLAVEKEIGLNEIPELDSDGKPQGGKFIAVLDVKLKSLSEDTSGFTFETRAKAADPRDFDSSSRGSAQWEVSLKAIDDTLGLGLAVDPQGHALWGEGTTLADGGRTHVTMFEVPQQPITSLAQFQHTQTGFEGSSSVCQIGNSFVNPGMPDLSKVFADRMQPPAGSFSSTKGQNIIDEGWILNDTLWDGFLFSGINWGESENAYADKQPFKTQQQAIDVLINNDRDSELWDAKNPWPLQNPRLDLYTRELTDEDKAEMLEYDKIVKHLALYGGFNINSTSEKAWEALFFSMKGEIVRYLDNGTVKAEPEKDSSFGRFTSPVAAKGELFGSYRTLTDEQIRELAKQMVIQVKQRGPFMGLGDFVNRRLSNTEKGETGYETKVGQLGALQAAITAAGLNPVPADEQQESPHIKNKIFKVAGTDYQLSKYQTTSKYLLQADILNGIGGAISARSDTFTIRAYGCSKDADNNIVAEAYCEARIQRTPEWLDPTEEENVYAITDPALRSGLGILKQYEEVDTLSDTNKKYGRRFKEVSFRWLLPSEV